MRVVDALLLSAEKSVATPANWPNNHADQVSAVAGCVSNQNATAQSAGPWVVLTTLQQPSPTSVAVLLLPAAADVGCPVSVAACRANRA